MLEKLKNSDLILMEEKKILANIDRRQKYVTIVDRFSDVIENFGKIKDCNQLLGNYDLSELSPKALNFLYETLDKNREETNQVKELIREFLDSLIEEQDDYCSMLDQILEFLDSLIREQDDYCSMLDQILSSPKNKEEIEFEESISINRLRESILGDQKHINCIFQGICSLLEEDNLDGFRRMEKFWLALCEVQDLGDEYTDQVKQSVNKWKVHLRDRASDLMWNKLHLFTESTLNKQESAYDHLCYILGSHIDLLDILYENYGAISDNIGLSREVDQEKKKIIDFISRFIKKQVGDFSALSLERQEVMYQDYRAKIKAFLNLLCNKLPSSEPDLPKVESLKKIVFAKFESKVYENFAKNNLYKGIKVFLTTFVLGCVTPVIAGCIVGKEQMWEFLLSNQGKCLLGSYGSVEALWVIGLISYWFFNFSGIEIKFEGFSCATEQSENDEISEGVIQLSDAHIFLT